MADIVFPLHPEGDEFVRDLLRGGRFACLAAARFSNTGRQCDVEPLAAPALADGASMVENSLSGIDSIDLITGSAAAGRTFTPGASLPFFDASYSVFHTGGCAPYEEFG